MEVGAYATALFLPVLRYISLRPQATQLLHYVAMVSKPLSVVTLDLLPKFFTRSVIIK